MYKQIEVKSLIILKIKWINYNKKQDEIINCRNKWMQFQSNV